MNIVSLLPSATEIVASLGLIENLVGVTHSCDFPESVSGLPRVTSTVIPKEATSRQIDRAVKDSRAQGAPLYVIDLDLLESLDPDLLITQGVCDVCAVCEMQALATLPELAREPVVVNLTPHRLQDVLDDVILIGRAAGVEERAWKLVEESRQRIGRVRSRVEGLEPVSVVVLEWIDPLFSAGHWTPDVVELAGGYEPIAMAGARSRQLRWDEILHANPEVLVLACCGQDIQRAMQDWGYLRGLPGFEELRAVLSGSVFVADGAAHFSRPSLRLIDSLELLAESLHPSSSSGARSLTRVSSVLE
jgi:iron complex transport system substrate-binding protein